MIAGHLQIKNDNYYMVLNYTDANGKRRQPWIPTGLPAKGNKRRAEKLLLDTRKSFVPPVVSKENEDISSDMLFADYMELWLEIIRSSVEKTTFSSYTQMVKGKIAPYFRNTGLTLDGIQAKHILCKFRDGHIRGCYLLVFIIRHIAFAPHFVITTLLRSVSMRTSTAM